MSKDMPVTNRCNAISSDGGYCMRYPATDRDGDVINGRCYIHGGHPNMGQDSPEDAADAVAIDTNRSEYYQKLSATDQIWVDKVVETFVNRADFTEEDLGLHEILREVAIDLHKIRRGNNELYEDGLTQDVVVDTDEDGNPVTGERENNLNLPIDRLEKTTIKRLKELGCLPDPDSDQAEATQTLAEVLSGSAVDEDK